MEKKYKALIACVILLLVTIVLMFSIEMYFKPFLLILLFYILCKPLYKLLVKIIKKKRIASVMSIMFINILIICIVYYLGSTLILKIAKIYYDNSIKLENILKTIYDNEFFNAFNIDKLKTGLVDGDFVQKGAFYTGESIISYFIANISVYFLLCDGREIFSGILSFIPTKYYTGMKSTINNLKSMINIEIMLILINSLELFIGFKILNVKEALTLALICGVLDLLPYVGTIIVFIPLIIYNIVLKEYFVVLGLICLYILVLVVREILETKFIGNKLNLHPFIVLVAIYVGMKLFGILGLIVGPLYVLLAKEILLEET